jgi:membrane protein DedA with SNARE-associated domain
MPDVENTVAAVVLAAAVVYGEVVSFWVGVCAGEEAVELHPDNKSRRMMKGMQIAGNFILD